MTKNLEKTSAHIEVIPATRDQQPVLANHLELHARDFSEFNDLKLGEDGRIGYKHLPLYCGEVGTGISLFANATRVR